MDSMKYIKNYLSESIDTKSRILADENLLERLRQLTDLVTKQYRLGHKILIAGNGGSAADAQHIAAEFVSRFFFDRPGLPALALTTDTSMLTAIGNDYGFENIFSRQIEAQGVKGDVFLGITTSGNSKNVLKAMEAAKQKGIITVAFCGESGEIIDIADIVINVPSTSTPYIQECHICLAHILCALVEENIFGEVRQSV